MHLHKGRPMSDKRWAEIYFSEPLTIRSEFLCITESLASAALLDYFTRQQADIGLTAWICEPFQRIRANTYLSEGEFRYALAELLDDGLITENEATMGRMREFRVDTNRIADKVAGGDSDANDAGS